MKFFFTFFLSISLFILNAQSLSYPSIAPPLAIPLTLSGTFCELRSNHFHAGLDLRTYGQEGHKVLAVAPGFVSRIKISGSGYGNALYISHPNGYTSVYAHLQGFNEEITAFARKIQYHFKQSEIDTFLPPLMIMVKASEQIALSGNSGGSQAPHLHFEMRKTATQAPYNPKLFGLFIMDTIAPYPGNVLLQSFEQDTLFAQPFKINLIKTGEIYTSKTDTIKVNAKKIGLSIFTEDRMENNGNSNGIYFLQMKINDKTHYQFHFEKLENFEETRKIAAHYEHAVFKKEGIKYHRCYQLPGNDLSTISSNEDRGYIYLKENEAVKMDLLIQDLCFNQLKIHLILKQDNNASAFQYATKPYTKIFPYHQSNFFKTDDLSVYFPENTFYQDLYFTFKEFPNYTYKKTFSKKYQIHHEEAPCSKSFTVKMKIDSFPEYLKDKAIVVRENMNGSKSPLACKWVDENTIRFLSGAFGLFYLSIDTTPPMISPVNIYENKLIKFGQKIQFKISDNLSGIKNYNLYINDNWVLTSFDKKNNLLTHTFDTELPEGEHHLVFLVEDELNNTSFFKTKFRTQ